MSWRTTPGTPTISSTSSPSAGRNSRGSTTARTSTCRATRNSRARSSSIWMSRRTSGSFPTSAGADRTTLVVMVDAYHEEEVGGEKRVVLRLHPAIAPLKAAVFPLVNKDGMPELARRIFDDVRKHYNTFYDDGGSIGR